jgi:hypothetical protein
LGQAPSTGQRQPDPKSEKEGQKEYGNPRTKPGVGLGMCAPFSVCFASRALRNAVVRAHLINATKPPKNENEKKKKPKQKDRKAKEETGR